MRSSDLRPHGKRKVKHRRDHPYGLSETLAMSREVRGGQTDGGRGNRNKLAAQGCRGNEGGGGGQRRNGRLAQGRGQVGRLTGSGDDLASRQSVKGRPEEDKPPEDANRRGGTRAGEEEARRRGKGFQGMETRPSSGPARNGTQIEAVKGGGGWFKEMAEEDGT